MAAQDSFSFLASTDGSMDAAAAAAGSDGDEEGAPKQIMRPRWVRVESTKPLDFPFALVLPSPSRCPRPDKAQPPIRSASQRTVSMALGDGGDAADQTPLARKVYQAFAEEKKEEGEEFGTLTSPNTKHPPPTTHILPTTLHTLDSILHTPHTTHHTPHTSHTSHHTFSSTHPPHHTTGYHW